MRKGNDAGATFADTIKLSKKSDNSSHPVISIHNNKVNVVWQDNSLGTVDDPPSARVHDDPSIITHSIQR